MTPQNNETRVTEPAPIPLLSVDDVPLSDFPTVKIPENRLYLLEEHARRIADSWGESPETYRTGILGEDAFAHHLGISDRLDIQVYADGGDGGVDLRFCGGTIDVKTVGRHRSNPALTVDAYEPLTADYYVLVSRIGKVDFRLLGYAPRRFVANAPVQMHEGEPYHIVDQSYLFPVPQSIL